MAGVFRQVSLDRLSSPEQLDQLIKVTSTMGWASLMAMALLLGGALFWGIFGSIPTTATGGGILIKTGGVVNIVSPVRGQVTSIYVTEGDFVKKGQIVGRIAQPELLEKIRTSKAKLAEIKNKSETTNEYGSANIRLQMEYLEKERESIAESIRFQKEKLKWAEEKIEDQTELLKSGLITKQALINSRSNKDAVEERISQLENQMNQMDVKELDLKKQKDLEILNSQMSIAEAERGLKSIEEKFEFESRVVSSHTGRVVEVRALEGSIVQPGTPLFNLELTGNRIQDLQAVIYVPPQMGKQIKNGMRIRITPTTVKQEEYGFMQAIVTYVSDFPATKQGMNRILENESLVSQFSQQGAPIVVYADLVPDPQTISGYKWSSPKGPPTEIYSGTLCTASAEVRTQPPLSLVIPYLKKQMGI